MKSLLFATLAFLFASSALADFRPGRVRVGGTAEMTTTDASGVFAGIPGAHVEMNLEDGKPYAVSFLVTMPRLGTTEYRVTGVRPSRCGDTFYAKQTDGAFPMTLVLTDYTGIRCRIFVAQAWHLAIQSNDAQAPGSIRLEGTPELLDLTQ